MTCDSSDWSRFQEAARQFCAVIETVAERSDWREFFDDIAQPLTDLYAAGLRLPTVSPTLDSIEIEKPGLDESHTIYMAVEHLIVEQDAYKLVPDPYGKWEIVEGLIGDDLSDIYRDVFPAAHWSDEDHLDDLVFELRLSFQGHWGRHALEAMRAIHWGRSYW